MLDQRLLHGGISMSVRMVGDLWLASAEDHGDDEPFSDAARLIGEDRTDLLSTWRCDLGKTHTL